jgi:putative transcriptional regulator
MKDSLGSLTQGLIDAGLGSPFSEKELSDMGIKIPEIKAMTPRKIKKIRDSVNLSQSVFARLLNVSLSSVKQWEQGKRFPTGSALMLLDLLYHEPHALDYRLKQGSKNHIAA